MHRATVIDGRVQHCLLLEIFTDDGIGTMVLSDPTPTSKKQKKAQQ